MGNIFFGDIRSPLSCYYCKDFFCIPIETGFFRQKIKPRHNDSIGFNGM